MPHEPLATQQLTTRRVLTRYLALVFSLGLVVAFYAWATSPGVPLFARFDGGGSYYNLLARGFRSGHLSLLKEVPPGVLKLKDPYDPQQNAPFGMHDVSYYKGKFYLYFGAAPALLLYGPFAAIFGRELDDRQAVFLFSCGAFLAGSFLLTRIRRRHFPGIGIALEAGGLIAIGLAAMVPVLLRRQQVYEVAISSADAFFIASLLCLYLSLSGDRRLSWLACASLSYGFAIASRPTYLFGAACLLVPVLFNGRSGEPTTGVGGSGRLARAFAATIPVTLVTACILLYNYLRFDNPFEFGYHFAFSGNNESSGTHFSPSFVWFNCRAYLFAPAHLSAYFPFVRVASLPRPPSGYMGFEDPYGIFPNMPFVALAFAAPWVSLRRPGLASFALATAISSLAVAAVIFTFQFAANRYMVDFLPGIVILAVIGFWGLAEHPAGLGRRALTIACWVLLIWSVLFNLFASFGHNEYLRISNPAIYRSLAHAFGFPRYAFDRISGRDYGPLELTVKFPADKREKLEPLLITGADFLSDYLYVVYVTSSKIVVGFEHTSYGGPTSDEIPIDYHQAHRITVDMPPLYPPLGDPYFDGIPKGAVESFGERLTIDLDGIRIIDTAQQFYPPIALRPSIGSGGANQTSLGNRFSGEILGVRRLTKDWRTAPSPALAGPMVILLEFPVGQLGAHEPIISSGFAGRGDVLSVGYVDARHVTFSFDHWGAGGPTSDPVEIKPGVVQNLEVRFGSFFPASKRPSDVPASLWADASGRLQVILDNHMVFEVKASFYEVPAETVVVGRNAIGSSSCTAKFTGQVVSSTRVRLR